MPTHLASEDLGQGVLLGLGGSFVQIEDGFPITLRHVPGGVCSKCDIEAA